MNNLLDTHSFIWFITGDQKLSKRARQIIEESSVSFISIASLWEIAIKISLGKLELKFPFLELLYHIELNNFQLLPITFEDTKFISDLPLHHRDPFDRLIIAQCINNNLTLISKRYFSERIFSKSYLVNFV